MIGQRAYVVTGGNWGKLLGREWFPVRLIEVEAYNRHRVMCELLPQYRQRFVELDDFN